MVRSRYESSRRATFPRTARAGDDGNDMRVAGDGARGGLEKRVERSRLGRGGGESATSARQADSRRRSSDEVEEADEATAAAAGGEAAGGEVAGGEAAGGAVAGGVIAGGEARFMALEWGSGWVGKVGQDGGQGETRWDAT